MWALVLSALVKEGLPGVVAAFAQRPVEVRGFSHVGCGGRPNIFK